MPELRVGNCFGVAMCRSLERINRYGGKHRGRVATVSVKEVVIVTIIVVILLLLILILVVLGSASRTSGSGGTLLRNKNTFFFLSACNIPTTIETTTLIRSPHTVRRKPSETLTGIPTVAATFNPPKKHQALLECNRLRLTRCSQRAC